MEPQLLLTYRLDIPWLHPENRHKSKYWNVVNGQTPMMGSSHGGQEELASVAGLRDGFHQPRAALAERVPGG